MILIPFLYMIWTTFAYKISDSYYRHGLRNNDGNKHLYNNNFSEDELIAINNYKRASETNSRHFNAIDDIFDARLFDNRRLFAWIKKLSTNKNKTAPKQPRYEDLVNDKIFYLHLTKNLTENLTKLTNVLDLFTKTLKERSTLDELRRSSRSVKDKHGSASNAAFVADETKKVEKPNSKNDSVKFLEETVDATEEPNEENSGRRTFSSLDLKYKLLSAINDSVNIIQYKLGFVSNIDEVFADRAMYKVGYIAGALVAIKGFVDVLQMSVMKNDGVLNDKYILDMYDTVNRIKEGTARLLEVQNEFVHKATNELIKS